MKILIVNAQNDTPNGHKMALIFRNLVQKIYQEDKDLLDDEVDYVVRDQESISDYLYETQSSYVNQHALNSFQSFDMIFISVNGNYLPWESQLSKVLILIRMCLNMGKYLFACSSAMQALVYVSASNFDRTVYMINPKGEPNIDANNHLNDLPLRNYQGNSSLNNNKYFIDRRTGDIFTYHQELSQWVPKANAGIHNRKAAQEFQLLGKYILKAPTFRPKQSLDNNFNDKFIAKNTEVVVHIKKEHLNHYAFQNLGNSKFVACTKSKWNVHTFPFKTLETTFRVLAESDRGPMIIEYGNHILATLFEMDSHYQETLVPLKNFIKATTQKIYNCNQKQKKSYGILTVTKQVNDKKRILDLNLEFLFPHKETLQSSSQTPRRSFELRQGAFTMKQDTGRKTQKSNPINTKNLIDMNLKLSIIDTNNQNMWGDVARKLSSLEFQKSNHKRISSTQGQEESTSQIAFKFFERQQIRLMLHPELNKDIQKCDSHWIPNLSTHLHTQRVHTTRAVSNGIMKQKEPQPRILIKNLSQRPFTNYIKHKEIIDKDQIYSFIINLSLDLS